MGIQIIKMWDVHVWDGGDRQNYEASFSTEAEAKKVAGTHDYVSSREVVVFDSAEGYKEFKNGLIKEKALSKLSDIEKKALGLK